MAQTTEGVLSESAEKLQKRIVLLKEEIAVKKGLVNQRIKAVINTHKKHKYLLSVILYLKTSIYL